MTTIALFMVAAAVGCCCWLLLLAADGGCFCCWLLVLAAAWLLLTLATAPVAAIPISAAMHGAGGAIETELDGARRS